MTQEHVNYRDARALFGAGKAGKAFGGNPIGKWGAKRAESRINHLRFPSIIQRDVYDRLSLGLAEGDVIICDPMFHLAAIALKGDLRPARYRPDFMVIEQAPATPPITGLFSVEIHEAKGDKRGESRDWRLRAGAALKAWPSIPMFVWKRNRKKQLQRYTLQEILG